MLRRQEVVFGGSESIWLQAMGQLSASNMEQAQLVESLITGVLKVGWDS